MSSETIIAGGCVALVCSAWNPWYWTKHWGSGGFSGLESTHCRFDCGWEASTYNEVHAITLERRPGRHEIPTRKDHDPEYQPEHGLPGSDDIVSEQYSAIRSMYVRRDGLVVNLIPQEVLEASRSTAQNVNVGDALRTNKSAEVDDVFALRERTRDRLLKLQDSLKINDRLKRLGSIKPRFHRDLHRKDEEHLVPVEEIELEPQSSSEPMKRSISAENATLVEGKTEGEEHTVEVEHDKSKE
ncbi:hypothetical protein FRC03_007334 [Tulasnella sp. 419]|nr:hypothetical protein FRC02_007466 [Tulasnella sp. 418]KAG8959890.1 hypothetical protein FRC03_007334 [Tulasnella sp. 419]